MVKACWWLFGWPLGIVGGPRAPGFDVNHPQRGFSVDANALDGRHGTRSRRGLSQVKSILIHAG